MRYGVSFGIGNLVYKLAYFCCSGRMYMKTLTSYEVFC